MLKIGYIDRGDSRRTGEEWAAWEWLSREATFESSRLSFAEIAAEPTILERFDAFWCHCDSDGAAPPEILQGETRTALLASVRSGRGLLLSLLAASWVVDVGIETERPNFIRRGSWGEASWAEGYPDIRGFGSFQGHPIFEGLGGGVYTWNPVPDSPVAGAFYEAPAVPRNGRVVAVERQYIKLNENRRIVCEYGYGTGKLLTIGAFVHFSKPNDRFRLHLERFLRNTLAYLGGGGLESSGPVSPSVPASWWDFSNRSVELVTRRSAPLTAAAPPLPEVTSGLSITRDPSEVRNDPFNVGGRRLLIMGKERTGVQEIWCHPFRLLRNLRLAVQIGAAEPKWLDELDPLLTVRPESISRTYLIGELRLEETIFASHDNPTGAVQYSLHSNHPLRLLATCSVDLRLMWPYSEKATGSLICGWDDGLRAAVVRNQSGNLIALIGASRLPDQQRIGRYASFRLAPGGILTESTESVEVGVAMLFDVSERHTELVLGFAGSDSAEEDAVHSYRSLMENPGREYERQAEHFAGLLATSAMVSTPDSSVNDGYRWALVGTDRFVVETPKLGTSLMAGFGATERGWDGGHAVSGRPGYAWYFGRDAIWTSLAMLDYGDFSNVRSVLEFLGRHQDLSGKILHELTSSGHAHYDAADSTPLFILLMGRYLRASGDIDFVRREFPRLRKAVEFCSSTDTDGDGLIENTNVGHGWVEGGKLFPVHTEMYLAACWCAALDAASLVARSVDEGTLADRWDAEAGRTREIIRKEFWNPQSQFYNFGKLADGTYVSEPTALPAVAAYLGVTDPARDLVFVKKFSDSEFSADWGVRILGRSSPMYNPRGYHTGSVWPLFTGWASLAEFAALRPTQGFLHAMSNLMLYRLWAAGFIEEVLRGDQLTPAGVCSHQAWSESMVLQPVLEGMMGLRVDALSRTVTLRPYLPPQWDTFELNNIRCGKHRLSWRMEHRGDSVVDAFEQAGPEKLRIRFQPLLPLGTRVVEIRVDTELRTAGMRVGSLEDSPLVEFEMGDRRTVTMRTSGGIALVPPMPNLTVDEASRGIRVLEEQIREKEYVLSLEGKSGEEYRLQLFDQDRRVTAVEGATAEERRGSLLFFTVGGEKGSGEGYVRREVRFRLRE